jgi:two-component system, OmpR family, KDP operon response regulator KdpE
MSPQAPTILVIEDELPIRLFLRATLTSNGYQVAEAATGRDGIRAATTQPPDLVLLDLGLPDIDGLEVQQQLRGWSTVPIIVVSARGQEQDKITALDAGADDYLTKPFNVGELLARIRVALRNRLRGGVSDSPQFRSGELEVDLAARQVFVGANEVHLTPIEYKLLTTLVRHAGKVVTHRMLLQEVWGPGHAAETQYLRIYLGHLRRKLEADPARPRYLLTEPGVGYRLHIDEA